MATAETAFSPLTLRGLTLQNRFIKSATHDGSTMDAKAAAYRRLARNGVSLSTVAYMSICADNTTFDNQHHIDDQNLAQWTELVGRVREVGGKLAAQLHHPGLFTMSTKGRPMGPSFFALPSKLAWPHVMTRHDLEAVTAQYVAAALLCARAGFEAIELHCGQYVSP